MRPSSLVVMHSCSVPPCGTPQYGNFPASIIFFATTRRALEVFCGYVLAKRLAPISMA